MPTAVPRQVFKSKTLNERILDGEAAAALEEIERKILAGEDITPYMSKKVLDPSYNDRLFNEWLIHHFHLSTTKKPNERFYSRADHLLFIAFGKTQAFFIDVLEHAEDYVFAKQEFLKIMMDNWPPIMQPFVLDHYDPLFVQDYTDANREKWRRFGYSISTIRIGNRVIRTPGIGITTTGTNLHVAKQANEVYRFMQESLEEIEKNREEILCELNRLSGKTHETMVLVVKRRDVFPFFGFYEENSG
jgi:hypothetical protein